MDETTPRPTQPHATGADLAAIAGLSGERRALLTLELAARRRAATTAIRRQPRDQPEPRFPLSYAQERLWYLDQADPGSVSYVMPGAVRLRGALDEDALRAALREIVRRHEVLRTVFISERGVPVQRIRPPADVAVPTVDLTTVPAERRDDVLDDQRQGEATRAFALDRDLMLRARLLRFADDDHVLLLTMHHIASDGWSIGVLVRELGALYSAFHRGDASPLPEPAVQYADYAVWQRDWLAAGPLEAQLAFWREQLGDAPVLDLPTDHPAAASRSSVGSSVPVAVAADVATRVTALAKATGSTLYMVLAAAFAVVLSRWSGQPEVMIGLPVAGRRRTELEPLVGFFVNTLPLRVTLSGSPSFEQLLGRVRETCVAAYGHQDVPFERLVQNLAPTRETGVIPLVQAMLAVRDVPMDRLVLGDLTAELLPAPTSQSSKFAIVLDLVPDSDGALTGYLEYSDLFVRATAQRMAEAFLVVLTAALTEPGRPIDRLPLQSRAERDHRLLGELAGGNDVAPADGCLHTTIEARAAEQPERWAVQCGASRLTYRELMARADRLASRLHALGARAETLVGVCMSRSVDLVVALLGVLKTGAAYVPLDPGYPPERVRTALRDSSASIVVTDEVSVAAGVLSPAGPDSEPGPRLVVLGPDDAQTAEADPAPATAGLSRSLAYVIYTSGSTGTPKGSANEHGGVLRTLTELNRAIGLTADDRVLAMSSLNYDMSVYEIFGSLLAGACVVIPDEAEVTDPERLGRLLTEAGVTMWSSAPALLELLVDYEHTRGRLSGAQLRLAGLAGDRIPPVLVQRLHQMLPGLRLYNVAGMAEVSYCSTYHHVRWPEPVPGSIPWGRPLPGQRLYVLDRLGEPVPVGVRGELFIGGSGVRRGYWNRPALTADRFVPDPFGPVPGGRLYRTGDAARWRPTGDLEFLGRLDQQVKIRGMRVELGEIESALAAHPDVREAVVVLQPAGADERLAAYVVADGPLPPSAARLRRHLAERLPRHMVPSAFVPLDRLPLLPSGKLDRSALPAPPPTRQELATTFTAPSTPLERVLAGIWADVIELDRVGVTDDFFELGGHSLLVTQVVHRIRELLRVSASVQTFLSTCTVATLAQALRAEGAEAGVDVDRVAELALAVSAMDEDEVAAQLARGSG